MLTKMTEEDWVRVLEVFHACRSRRGDKGRDDRKFFEALHYFTPVRIRSLLGSSACAESASSRGPVPAIVLRTARLRQCP
jgi:hypothetical protein